MNIEDSEGPIIEMRSGWNFEKGVAIDGPLKDAVNEHLLFRLTTRHGRHSTHTPRGRTNGGVELSAYETCDHIADLGCRQGALAIRGDILCAVTFG